MKIYNQSIAEIADLTFRRLSGEVILSSGRGGSVEDGLEGGGVGESGRARAGRNGTSSLISSSSSFTSVVVKLSKMLEVFEVFEMLEAGRSLSKGSSFELFLLPLLLPRHLLTPAVASLIATKTTSWMFPLWMARVFL